MPRQLAGKDAGQQHSTSIEEHMMVLATRVDELCEWFREVLSGFRAELAYREQYEDVMCQHFAQREQHWEALAQGMRGKKEREDANSSGPLLTIQKMMMSSAPVKNAARPPKSPRLRPSGMPGSHLQAGSTPARSLSRPVKAAALDSPMILCRWGTKTPDAHARRSLCQVSPPPQHSSAPPGKANISPRTRKFSRS